MNAKEMFEELGYRLVERPVEFLDKFEIYNNKKIMKKYEYGLSDVKNIIYIMFFEENKFIKICYDFERVCFISVDELQAINQQVKELRVVV